MKKIRFGIIGKKAEKSTFFGLTLQEGYENENWFITVIH